MKSKKFRPYIRLANGREVAGSLRIVVRLAFYRTRNRPFYVMVQHGFPNSVMDVGASRRSLEQGILVVFCKQKSFKQWARDIQRRVLPVERGAV